MEVISLVRVGENAQVGNIAGADVLAGFLCSLFFPFHGTWESGPLFCADGDLPRGKLVISYALRARLLLGKRGLRQSPLLSPCSILNTF